MSDEPVVVLTDAPQPEPVLDGLLDDQVCEFCVVYSYETAVETAPVAVWAARGWREMANRAGIALRCMSCVRRAALT